MEKEYAKLINAWKKLVRQKKKWYQDALNSLYCSKLYIYNLVLFVLYWLATCTQNGWCDPYKHVRLHPKYFQAVWINSTMNTRTESTQRCPHKLNELTDRSQVFKPSIFNNNTMPPFHIIQLINDFQNPDGAYVRIDQKNRSMDKWKVKLNLTTQNYKKCIYFNSPFFESEGNAFGGYSFKKQVMLSFPLMKVLVNKKWTNKSRGKVLGCGFRLKNHIKKSGP